MNVNVIHTVSFFGVVLSAMISAVLFFYPLLKKRFSPNIYLGLGFLGYGLMIFIFHSYFATYVFDIPYLYFFSLIIPSLIVPMPYLYLKKVVYREGFRKIDLLYFIPFVLSFINYIPFFLSTFEQKKEIATYHLRFGDEAIAHFHITLFTEIKTHLMLSFAFIFVFYFLQLRILIRLLLLEIEDFWEENDVWLRWFILFFVAQTMFVLPIPLVYWFADMNLLWKSSLVLLSCGAILTSIFLITKPELLFGIKGVVVYDEKKNDLVDEEEKLEEIQTEEKKQKTTQYISEKQLKLIESSILPYLSENKSFLQKGYSIQDLALETGISAKLISQYINQHQGQSFFDFINSFRVNYLENIETEVLQQQTLEAISEKIGFNNRTSFVNAVKKEKGLTPSKFVESILAQRQVKA